MIDEILKYLKIDDLECTEQVPGKKWLVELDNDMRFSKVFGILDADTDFYEDDEGEEMTEEKIVTIYESKDARVTLTADLNINKFTVLIEKPEETKEDD